MSATLLCSECFQDQGLRLNAAMLGIEDSGNCPQCDATDGRKLDAEQIEELAHRFFVRGSVHKSDYGAAPRLQFNTLRYPEEEVTFPAWLANDARLISEAINIGIFHYGPRLWMVGEIEPLKSLQDSRERDAIIQRILVEYPTRTLAPGETFYRLRIDPQQPPSPTEYDSPPPPLPEAGRLDSRELSVMYCSPDLEVCVHECRVTVDDTLFVATLTPLKPLRLLDLTAILEEKDVTEFESLDMAVHMLFLAGGHSYDITRAIAQTAFAAGFDGLVYSSYYSPARTGSMPFDTAYGISLRRFRSQTEYVKHETVPNLALFGRPISEGKVEVTCVDRVVLNRVVYDIRFGPADF